MTRKDFLWFPPAIITCLILGVVLLAVWIVLAIPMMVYPSLIPDPRIKISAIIVKRSMKSMMGGMRMPTV